jgi:hypothetical protein
MHHSTEILSCQGGKFDETNDLGRVSTGFHIGRIPAIRKSRGEGLAKFRFADKPHYSIENWAVFESFSISNWKSNRVNERDLDLIEAMKMLGLVLSD